VTIPTLPPAHDLAAGRSSAPAPAATLADARVGVLGLGRLGLQLARTLASLGVHRLVLDDPATVHHDDLGAGGYRLADLGDARPHAAARALADTPTTRTAVSPGVLEGHDPGMLTAAVVVTHERLDPACAWRLLAQGVPHLVVTWSAGALEIGPGVVPGRTACLRCLDLHRVDEGAAPARGRHVGAGLEDPVLALAGAGLAAARTLSLLTPGAGASGLARTTTLTLPDLVQSAEYWPVHPACGCA